MTESNVT